MTPAPTLVLLDVNETLSDLTPVRERFTDLGVPEHLATLWFASVLREGFALTAMGAAKPFALIARGVLGQLLPLDELDRSLDDAVDHVLTGFTSLVTHPDVVPGLQALTDAGFRVATLSNGAVSVAEALLDSAGARHLVEACLSVDEAGAWKPAAAAYAYAAEDRGVAPGDCVMAAVHPWDLEGAMRAGLHAAYVNRSGRPYPSHLAEPTVTVSCFTDLAGALTR